jgi:hypothetical protein
MSEIQKLEAQYIINTYNRQPGLTPCWSGAGVLISGMKTVNATLISWAAWQLTWSDTATRRL